MKKSRREIQKLEFKRNTKISNLSTEEWAALKSLSKRKDVIKAADKGVAVVVWRTDLYRQEVFRQLSDTSFYAKVAKDLTSVNEKLSNKLFRISLTNKNYQ